uniref:Translation initiation inhibitor n=1 Tax=Chromulina nebulosa TaxID=96789 RepID=A0A7S0XC35_9STRA|mmetsp:Transcript_2783/g.2442  ORF Transcript_2783/g.2442 Transcript_2783/m.2442 type:complete len:130 (+) Transcript_2783:74-463(+)
MSDSIREVISTPLAPAAIGPYSQAIKANGFVFVSGCVGLDPNTKTLVSGGLAAQTKQVLINLKNIVEASGSSLSKVVKTTILLADISTFSEVNTIYGEYFSSDPPARATYAVAGLPLGALVEIECIALA